MTGSPYLLEKAREGYRVGHGELIDSMIKDGLWDPYGNVSMGSCGELCAEKFQSLGKHRMTLPLKVMPGL